MQTKLMSFKNSLFDLEHLTPKGSDMRFSPFGLRSELAFGAKCSKSKREFLKDMSFVCMRGYVC